MRGRPLDNQRTRQRGAILIWMAFFLVVMMMFIGLAMDASKVAATRAQLQATADAAALAGASSIDSKTGKILADGARSRAELAGSQNHAFVDEPVPVIINDGDVELTDTTCKVTVYRDPARSTGIVTYFAKVFGEQNTLMRASATALVTHPSSPCNLVPMGAIPPGSGSFTPDCSVTYDLKVGGGGSTTGNYQLLDFPPCDAPEDGDCAHNPTGGSTLSCLIANGYHCCNTIKEGMTLTTEPGNKVGDVAAGLQYRWNQDTDQRTNICYKDYTGNGERIVTVPLISDLPNGRSTVTVNGFMTFFLRDAPNGQTVKAEFVSVGTQGTGTGGSGNTVAIYLIK